MGTLRTQRTIQLPELPRSTADINELIKWSGDISRVIDKMNRQIRSDLDEMIMGAVSVDHGGLAGLADDDHCFSEDTELLTKSGFKYYDDISESDKALTFNMENDRLEYQNIQKIYIYDSFREMVSFKNRYGEILTTKKHRTIYKNTTNNKKNKSSKWLECTSEEALNKSVLTIPTGGLSDGKRYDISNKMLELLGIIISEGHFINPKLGGYGVQLYQKPGEQSEYIESVLIDVGAPYTKMTRQTDIYYIRSQWAKNNIRNWIDRKDISEKLMNLRGEQFLWFLSGLILGDGSVRSKGKENKIIALKKLRNNFDKKIRYSYHSSDKSLVDNLCHLCTLNGLSAYSYYRNGGFKNGCWSINIKNSKETLFKKGSKSIISYGGKAWCASVKNKTLVLRRNGFIFISGNTQYHNNTRGDARYAQISHTQAASTITDFDTEVSNNSDVSANTSARHTRKHNIDGTSDHDGVSSATENNFVSFNASGLPKDSGKKSSDFATSGHNHDSSYPALVNPSVTGNLVAFSNTTGGQSDSGVAPGDFVPNADFDDLEVLVNALGQEIYSLSGVVFYGHLAAENNQWMSIAYGNGVFVAVAQSGTNRVMRSADDGASWSAVAAAEANSWLSVAYGNGVFVAVAATGTNRVMRSTDDGASWSAVAAAEANSWTSVVYGNGVFVAVAADGTNRVMRSTDDGASWSAVAAAEANNWYSVAYGNGIFVAVATTGTNRVMRSTDDGASWSAVAAAEANQWTYVAYGGGVFVAVAQTGTNRVMRSADDGASWSAVAAAEANQWGGVAYGDGTFVAVSSDAKGFMRSITNGSTWTSSEGVEASTWRRIAYGNGVFVAVASAGSILTCRSLPSVFDGDIIGWQVLGGGIATLAKTSPSEITTTETTVISASIPANKMRAGTTFRIRLAGTYTTGITSLTANARVRIGTSLLGGTIPAELSYGVSTSKTNQPFDFEAYVTIISSGSSGTAFGHMRSTCVAPFAVNTEMTNMVTTAVSVDTTVQNYIEFTFQTGSSGHKYKFYQGVIELVRL